MAVIPLKNGVQKTPPIPLFAKEGERGGVWILDQVWDDTQNLNEKV
jgi:hypothetical protein